MKAILGELTKHMRTIDKGMEAAKKAGDETFLRVIGPYAVEAAERLKQLEADNDELTKGIAKAVTYLGEPADLVEKPEDGVWGLVGGPWHFEGMGVHPPCLPCASLQHAVEVHRGAAEDVLGLQARPGAPGEAGQEGGC